MLLREKLVRAEVAASKLGIREVGPDNYGPQVKKFLHEVHLPQGYAWCDAFQSYEEHAAAGHTLPIESASVSATYAEAKKLGWVVTRPFRGDLVLFDWQGTGGADDHIGIVVKVRHLPTTPGRFLGDWILTTVEGNTGPQSGSGRDGVYIRTRTVTTGTVRFVRIPGSVSR